MQKYIQFSIIIFLSTSILFGQNCNQLPSSSDFTVETIENNADNNAYDIDVDNSGNVYWVERLGDFKVHNQTSGVTTTIHNFDVHILGTGWDRANEGGLQGIALDNDFETNNWVYIFYSVPANQLSGTVSPTQPGPIERVSRFTLTNNKTNMNMSSEKVIFEHTIRAQCCHHGGDLVMDDQDNLWITTGDNINPSHSNGNPKNNGNVTRDVQGTAGNTNDYRGKVLRIKPIKFADNLDPNTGIGNTYDIPNGNLFASGTANTKPEIYSMGHRNPFSIAVQKENKWLGIGEASGGSGRDEINIAVSPGFYGWPYFSGANEGYANPGFTANNVTNNSPNNTGLTDLPNAVGSAIRAGSNNFPNEMQMGCLGVVLDWINFDSTNQNANKFPIYFHNKLLVTSYSGSGIRVATVDNTGAVTNLEQWISSAADYNDLHRSIQGPDGAVYIAKGQYTFNQAPNSKIMKISYNGNCSPVITPVIVRTLDAKEMQNYLQMVAHFGLTIVTIPKGAVKASLYNTLGEKIWEGSRQAHTSEEGIKSHTEKIRIPSYLEKGLYQARFSP